jgi:hypothetical protein
MRTHVITRARFEIDALCYRRCGVIQPCFLSLVRSKLCPLLALCDDVIDKSCPLYARYFASYLTDHPQTPEVK